MADLLLYGANLRGLDEDVVDKCVSMITSMNLTWLNYYPSDSARICQGLAMFQKLTPDIFDKCVQKSFYLKLNLI